ncbi:hypothetical protein ACFE04_030520 [Oxalis oulophora]
MSTAFCINKDEFATLPAVVPKGPIAMLGLGGGTAARLMLDLWPSLEIHGWEIDQINVLDNVTVSISHPCHTAVVSLIDKARDYLGLSDLEKPTKDGGILHVHIGDALSTSDNDVGKYAGIVVDLFSDGDVLEQLEEAETWLELKKRLMPNGRVMVNCGGIDAHPIDGAWYQNPTIEALYNAFQGQISWKRTPKEQGENYMAFSGPLPDLSLWSAAVSGHLSEGVKQWKKCEPLT